FWPHPRARGRKRSYARSCDLEVDVVARDERRAVDDEVRQLAAERVRRPLRNDDDVTRADRDLRFLAEHEPAVALDDVVEPRRMFGPQAAMPPCEADPGHAQVALAARRIDELPHHEVVRRLRDLRDVVESDQHLSSVSPAAAPSLRAAGPTA